jgi:hypothetical protein
MSDQSRPGRRRGWSQRHVYRTPLWCRHAPRLASKELLSVADPPRRHVSTPRRTQRRQDAAPGRVAHPKPDGHPQQLLTYRSAGPQHRRRRRRAHRSDRHHRQKRLRRACKSDVRPPRRRPRGLHRRPQRLPVRLRRYRPQRANRIASYRESPPTGSSAANRKAPRRARKHPHSLTRHRRLVRNTVSRAKRQSRTEVRPPCRKGGRFRLPQGWPRPTGSPDSSSCRL